ncbi:MAG: hemerythrin family protein [Motiliproteus sp.]
MPIFWQDKMSVANEQIDDEHKYLFCLINTVELSLKLEGEEETLGQVIDQLIDYTQLHFDHEEKIQIKMKYPRHHEHRIEHLQILENLQVLKEQLTQKTESSGENSDEVKSLKKKLSKATEKEIVQLMREWVLDHVLKKDQDMTKYLSRLPSNFR